MKKLLTLGLFLSLFFAMYSQNKTNNKILSGETVVIRCSEFHVTPPLRDIVAEHPFPDNSNKNFFEFPDKEDHPAQKFIYNVQNDGAAYGNSPQIIQKDFGNKSVAVIRQNWEGQNTDWCRPFDPSGAVSSQHYIQMINSTTFKIWDKSGTEVLSGTLGDLWSPATENNGDPIVLYDKAADRWFLSQFGTEDDKKIYIAISQTNDPTGSWYTYTFVSPEFPDYLKFSVWQDAYYMTANDVLTVFAFNRAKMLSGDATAEVIYADFYPPTSGGFFVPLPADASDTDLPSAGTPCPIFSYSDNAWGSGISDAVHVYNASATWGSSPNLTVTDAGEFNTNAFDASYDENWEDIPQPGTSNKLDGIGGALMYRAQWTTWTDHNSVLLNWGVKISDTQRGIFWCEMRQDKASGNWSIYQQGIYAPGTESYWLGSMAMNKNGDIALCYAKSGTSTYMSLGFTGRHASDPLGTMTIAETIAKAGTGSQENEQRVGDYSQTCLDPDGITFWHTGEYLGDGGDAKTRVYSFRLPTGANVDDVQYDFVSLFPNPTDGNFSIVFNNITENYKLEIFDAAGRIIYTDVLSDNVNDINLQQQVTNGIYFLKVYNNKESKIFKLLIK